MMKFYTLFLLLITASNSFSNSIGDHTTQLKELCSLSIDTTNYSKNRSFRKSEILFTENDDYYFVAQQDLKKKEIVSNIYSIPKNDLDTREVLFTTEGKVNDILFTGNSVWLLQDYRILVRELDSTYESVITLTSTLNRNKENRAYDMEKMAGYILVASGVSGVKAVSIKRKKVSSNYDLDLIENEKSKSKAVAITKLNNHSFLVGVDQYNFTKQGKAGFNGIIELHPVTRKVIKYPFNYKNSGIFSSHAKMKVYNDVLWLNNWGKIQYINIDNMKKKGSVDISWLPTIFERADRNWAADPMGEFIIEDDTMHVCAKVSEIQTIKPVAPRAELYKIPELSQYK